MAWQVEQAVCNGRGFNVAAGAVPAGFMRALMIWAVKDNAAGGPGWFIHDDQSAIGGGADPYVVFCNLNAPGPNVAAKYVKVLLPQSLAQRVHVFYYLYWDATAHVGFGIYGAYDLRTDDSIDFIYDFRGGEEALFLHTFTTAGTWHGTMLDEWTADPNLLDSVDATTAVTNFTAADLQFRGVDILTGVASAVDANGNTYFNITFVTGTTWRVDQFASSARSTVVATGTFTGLAGATNFASVSLAASGGSGVTSAVRLQGPTVADATIVFRYNQITVGSGEGPQFVDGNYYFITDHTRVNAVNSFRVVSRVGDVLVVDRLYRPFPLGSRIGSYRHKFFCCGTTATTALMSSRCSIPYYNVLGSIVGYIGGNIGNESWEGETISSWTGNPNSERGPYAMTSIDSNYVTRMSPNRKGQYALQRPGVVERTAFGGNASSNQGEGVTGYGQLKNIIIGVQGTMSPNIHGRTLSGVDYIYFRNENAYINSGSNFAVLVRDSETP